MINLVSLIMFPTPGLPKDSCSVFLCVRLKRLRRAISPSIIATVITPMPPICISTRITICPNSDQYVPVSCVTRPVTHTAVVEVNRQSR